MNNIHIIIQARIGSTRLPNKMILKIKNKTIIEIMLDRLKMSKYSKNIIVAIPRNKKNNLLYELLQKKGYNVCLGSEKNVLDRYYKIAKKLKIKNIMRLTGDCPLIDYKICEKLANKFFKEKTFNLDKATPKDIRTKKMVE